jgi:hypothetical protein
MFHCDQGCLISSEIDPLFALESGPGWNMEELGAGSNLESRDLGFRFPICLVNLPTCSIDDLQHHDGSVINGSQGA